VARGGAKLQQRSLTCFESLFKAVHVLFAVIWVGGGVSIMIHAIRAQTTHDPESGSC